MGEGTGQGFSGGDLSRKRWVSWEQTGTFSAEFLGLVSKDHIKTHL